MSKKQNDKIDTVNIVMMRDGVLEKIYSYPDNKYCNKLAEDKFFEAIINVNTKCNPGTVIPFEDGILALEEGVFCLNEYEVFIAHSE